MTLGLAICLTAFAAFSLLWGRVLWYADQRSTVVRSIVFGLMSHSRRTAPELKSAVLTVLYLAFGITGAIGFSLVYGLTWRDLYGSLGLSLALIPLGIFASVSLSNLLMSLMFSVTQLRVDPIKVMQEVPWVEGIYRLPRRLRPFVPAVSGFLEETFFRGVSLLILIKHFELDAWLALAAVSGLFLLEQVLQTRALIQAVMIGISCCVISFVGGLLVFATGSVLAAALVHASFVMFYFRSSES